MHRDIAEGLAGLMRDCSDELNQSTELVKNGCTTEEFQDYRDAIDEIMGICVEAMTSIFKEHPDLDPKSLTSRGPSAQDPPR